MVVHSEYLLADVTLGQLNIYFQYVMFNSNLESQVLLANNTLETIHFSARDIIGHAEKIKQACPINMVRKDPIWAGVCMNGSVTWMI